MINECDLDCNGNIDFPELLDMMEHVSYVDQYTELQEAFSVFDVHGNDS